jgi:translation initiation factor 6
MPIVRVNFGRLPYLGVFALATEKMALLPGRFGTREKLVRDALGVRAVRASISKSPLIGVLAAGNSRGLIASNLMEAEEEELLTNVGINVVRMPSKYTATGNMVLANDRGALVNPDLSDEVLSLIGKTLGVPVERGTIAGLKNVGAAGVATNKGALVHPDASSEELELVEDALKVPVDIGTACGGVRYVGVCMIANSRGAMVGTTTTGPELGRIESALGFI